MRKIRSKISYKDNRGLIIDLLERKKINSITFITQKKGKVKLIMVDREAKHSLQIKQRIFFDLKWNEQTFKLGYNKETVPKPSNLEQMISIAEKLSSDFDFIRVDIFSNGTKCFVGEITNIHANASQKFIPTSDEKIVSKIIFN